MWCPVLAVWPPFSHVYTGWHAKRFEFEPEWDNDAEAAIAEIEFKETDTQEEEAAKLQLLAIYNKRLDEVRAWLLGRPLLHPYDVGHVAI